MLRSKLAVGFIVTAMRMGMTDAVAVIKRMAAYAGPNSRGLRLPFHRVELPRHCWAVWAVADWTPLMVPLYAMVKPRLSGS